MCRSRVNTRACRQRRARDAWLHTGNPQLTIDTSVPHDADAPSNRDHLANGLPSSQDPTCRRITLEQAVERRTSRSNYIFRVAAAIMIRIAMLVIAGA